MKRLPYRRKTGLTSGSTARPSDVLAANLYAYRVLQRMSQEELAIRMTELDHGWSRSTVSDVERGGRRVTTDEMFGLAISMGVSVAHLLDPAGPDQRRQLSLDVGLSGPDAERIAPNDAHLWVIGRAVIRFSAEEDRRIEVALIDGATAVNGGD
jgi:transcriptional regulator with XRE-family HTH domain